MQLDDWSWNWAEQRFVIHRDRHRGWEATMRHNLSAQFKSKRKSKYVQVTRFWISAVLAFPCNCDTGSAHCNDIYIQIRK